MASRIAADADEAVDYEQNPALETAVEQKASDTLLIVAAAAAAAAAVNADEVAAEVAVAAVVVDIVVDDFFVYEADKVDVETAGRDVVGVLTGLEEVFD